MASRILAAAAFHGGGLYAEDSTSPHVALPHIKARLLFGHAENDNSMPAEAIAKLDAILPSINMRTGDGPMAELEAFARGLETGQGGVLDATVYGGFSYGDVLGAGRGWAT